MKLPISPEKCPFCYLFSRHVPMTVSCIFCSFQRLLDPEDLMSLVVGEQVQDWEDMRKVRSGHRI